MRFALILILVLVAFGGGYLLLEAQFRYDPMTMTVSPPTVARSEPTVLLSPDPSERKEAAVRPITDVKDTVPEKVEWLNFDWEPERGNSEVGGVLDNFIKAVKKTLVDTTDERREGQ